MPEYSNVHGDYGIRSATPEEVESQAYNWDHCWLLCRISTGEVLAWDGGEPEDQLLIRDWKWVPQLLAEEATKARLAVIEEAAKHFEDRALMHPMGEDQYIADKIRCWSFEREKV